MPMARSRQTTSVCGCQRMGKAVCWSQPETATKSEKKGCKYYPIAVVRKRISGGEWGELNSFIMRAADEKKGTNMQN